MFTDRFARLGVAVFLVFGVLGVASAQVTVADLVASMPAQTTVDGDRINGEIVKLGSGAVQEICAMLVPLATGDDTNARFALSGLAKYVTAPGREEARGMVAAELVTAVGNATDVEVRTFLINQLQLAGKDEAVAALAGLLTDNDLCEPAAQALTAIATPMAQTALARALTSAQGPRRLTLTNAIGALRCPETTDELMKDVGSIDAVLRRTALFALANLGAPEAGKVLAEAIKTSSLYDRSDVTASYLLLAQRLAEAGDLAQCAGICRDLVKTQIDAPNVQAAALSTLLDATGEKGLGVLVAAVDKASLQLRAAIMQLALSVPGEAATQAWVKRMPEVKPEVKAAIIGMLGRRGDASAVPAVREALKDANKDVRLEAMGALARLAPDAAIGELMERLAATDDADEVAAAQGILLCLPGEAVVTAAANALAGVTPPARKALIEVLADRLATNQTEVVFAFTKDADESVRVAAIRALGRLAGPESLPRLVDLIVGASSDPELAAAHEVVVAISAQVPEADKRADDVLAAFDKAGADGKVRLMPTLAAVDGPQALALVAAEVQKTDAPAMHDAAVRALADWPNAAAIPELLKFAQSDAELTQQVLALRGYARLVGTGDAPAADKIRMYQDGLAAAKRPEEKALMLAGLGAVRPPEALQVVAGYLDDDVLKAQAALVAASIACPKDDKETGLIGPEVVAILQKATLAITDPDLKKKVEDQIAKTPMPDTADLALGKPVTTSVPQQGDNAPERAVDGNLDDASAWYGATWPAWLQVDLGEIKDIDQVLVVFYYDGTRYYQYTLDVSPDGQAWTTVADMSQYALPATAQGVLHTFDPIAARYVRVNILKNSVNEAVHLVELKVYAVGTGPATFKAPEPGEPDFVPIFNGKDMTGWVGDLEGYVADNGKILCKPGGNLETEKDYANFILRFEFKLTPGANNGLAVRVPMPLGNAAYDGMEIQILDDTAEQYKDILPYQHCCSIYGVVPAKPGHLKPVGEWNYEEVIADGRHMTVNLNGATVIDANLDEASASETIDHKDHPGLPRESGRLGFCGHGSVLEFRNLRVKELP